MKRRKLVVRLKGGLGNQMFQYAAALAMAARNGLELVIDTHSGFVNDRVFRRLYSLARYHLDARHANALERLPFLIEALFNKFGATRQTFIEKRLWGFHIQERQIRYYPELLLRQYNRNVWLDGYFQSEKYFKEIDGRIAATFEIRVPGDSKFLALAAKIMQNNAVAIGIRLHEEYPSGATNAAPLSFYENMARKLAKDMENPTFYLFCTVRKAINGKLNLPGEIHYVTRDDGYTDELSTLWLLSQFRYHIFSNSSFYWWGAWLAEQTLQGVKVFASDMFPNADTIPERWFKQVP